MSYLLIGLILVAFGFLHTLYETSPLEQRLVLSIQGALGRKPYLKAFQELWFFGRTAFTLVILTLLAGLNWKLGLLALGVFGITAGIEKAVKVLFNRSRPFKVQQRVEMLQPQEPADPSFPSGDALRIWFLVGILTAAVGHSLVFSSISITLALLVSLGRIVLGVHFLTDVLAGAGLGILGAGTTIWLWQTLQLI